MEKSFKHHAADYFRTYRLSRGQLCRLERMQAGGCARQNLQRSVGVSLLRVAMAVLLAGGSWLGWQQYQLTRQVEGLVAEIVYNHNKQMTMEINSDSIEAVKSFLVKLDFPLIAPQRLPGDQWQLLGGRYCSLQGKLAAQLKLRQIDSGKIYTLFQAANGPGGLKEAGIDPNYVEGVEVRLWSERGLLLGMAGSR